MSKRALHRGLLSLAALALFHTGVLFADGGGVRRVDCAHESLNDALAEGSDHPGPQVVAFTGTCTGDVTIPRSDITLQGADPSASIIGSVIVIGQSRVNFQNFTVRDTPPGNPITRTNNGFSILNSQNVNLTGITVSNVGNVGIDFESSSALITDCTVTRALNLGMAVALGSVVGTMGTITVTQGGSSGIMVTDTAQFLISHGQTVVATNNQGSGLFVQIQGHLVVHGEAHVTVDHNISGINVVDLGNFTYGNAFIEVSGNQTFGVQVGQLADWTIFAGIVPNLTITNNGGPGFVVVRNSFVRLRENATITGNAGPGLVVDGANVAVRGTVIQGNNSGNGDVLLNFGSGATFDGGNTVGTPIVCDGTSRSRGQYTCSPNRAAPAHHATHAPDPAPAEPR